MMKNHAEFLTAERAGRPLSVSEWVSVALRESGGNRYRAIEWVHAIWGPNPGARRLHALAKIIQFLAEEELP